jgi:hypothetical protein
VARSLHYAWNSDEIEALLLASPHVVLALSGHDHIGGYACNQGLHFVGFEGLVEAPEGERIAQCLISRNDRIDEVGEKEGRLYLRRGFGGSSLCIYISNFTPIFCDLPKNNS